ncbi:MAG TPA: branched-chain amino acid aminotransferase [Micromonosporaceae bacterium]|jgi:branched-chain amino acid aminotransferase|nr:branched-chain amino acid aminotransferase [Micromonosporaceae bacterium]
MSGGESLDFEIRPNPAPVSATERAGLLANPGFGRIFTDHMITVRYAESKGWYDARVEARGPITIDPATAVLHYAQEIFEGLKAYHTVDGGVALFRPEANARRFQRSAERMAMAEMPEGLFIDSLCQLVTIDQDWIPSGDDTSLYLRPFMFASEVFLGVKPSSEYMYLVIASPAGAYFKSGIKPITIWISDEFTRAAPGGTGAAKCGGNYAAGLSAQAEAIRNGCDQVVYLDAVERRYVDELGGMNLFFVMDDDTIITPPLGGTILPGVTRDSIITLAADRGVKTVERPYSIDEWRADAATGRLTEVFACGTAAVITPVGTVRGHDGDFAVGIGDLATGLREELLDIQHGRRPDRHGWMQKVI